ncbi:MAG TPA: sugar ABC transporter substrate-binding protein [Clostridia bacterium]|nr:sugar ABC transporter substrate-binding protein [Clostridia bacterium]
MTLRRAFTLFLCAIVVVYIFIGPALLEKMKDNYKKSLEPEHKKTEWTGVITLWDYPRLDIRNGTRFSWIKGKIRQFEKKNPGVYIEFQELDWKDGPSFLKAAAKTGANPDIAAVGSDYFFISGGYLEELDSYIDLEERTDFIGSILDTAVYKGKLYGIPWMMTGYTLLLNTDIFSERNVSLPENGEWTYEQFVEALKLLTYDTDGKGGPDVFGFNSFIEPGYYNAFGLLMSDGAQIVDETTGKYTFNTPEALSGLIKLCDLKFKYKVAHPDFGTMNENQAWSAFLKGETAVYTGGSWAVPLLRNSQGSSGINFTVARFPAGKSDVPLSISSTTCSYAVFKQKDEAKRKVCADFIKFLTSAETQEELVNFGYFSARKSGKHLYENDKEMYTIQQSLYFAEHLPKADNWSEIDLILQTKIKEAVQGSISPEQAIKDAERLIEQRRK